MKLLVVTDNFPSVQNQAAGAFVARRVSGYLERGINTVVATMTADRATREFESITHHVQDVDGYINFVKQFQPHVVAIHSPLQNNISGLAAEVSVSLSLPHIAWIHGYEALYTALHNYQEGWKIPFSLIRDFRRMRWLKRTLDNVNAAVFVSEWMKNIVIRYTDTKIKNSYVIPNPVNTKIFYPCPKSVEGSLKVVSVRGLAKKYGIDLGIRAFTGLKGVKLTIIGDGRSREDYVSLAHKLGVDCTFIKPEFSAKQLAEFYQSQHVFLAPSRTEAQGVAMCEAMATGLPVITTKVGGIPEFVRDGVDGYVVKPNNPQAIKDSLMKFVKEPLIITQMGQNAREHICLRCDDSLVIANEINIMESVL